MSSNSEQKQIDSLIPAVVDAVARQFLGKVTDTFSIGKITSLAASVDSALYHSEKMAKAASFGNKYDLHRDAMKRRKVDGLILEFGVASGSTINHIATLAEQEIYGFDTFSGLPEDWRPGFPRGAFRVPQIPEVRPNVQLVVGTFEETLPSFVQDHAGPISFLHVDCDLYSSTKAIFRHLAPWIVDGTIIVFDEYFNYPSWREHEYKAFQEYVQEFGIAYEYVSFVDNHQQVAVRIISHGTASGAPPASRPLPQTQLLTNVLSLNKFAFARADGTLLSANIRLLPDGSIYGSNHPNESWWKIEGDTLVFLDEDGRPSTIFDRANRANDGTVALAGRYLKAPDQEYVHRLSCTPMTEFASIVDQEPLSRYAPATANTAVLVRTYKCDAKYGDLMSKLDTRREGFDLYAIVDETHGRPDSGKWPAIWHSVEACRRLGLTQNRSDQLLRWCGDFPLYFALREIPDYDHYVMIEDDVELSDPDARFINELCKRLSSPEYDDVDFAGVLFQPDPGQIWGPGCGKNYGEKNSYLARFPFVIVSKRLCAYLFSQRQLEAARDTPREDVIHCEVFAASAAIAGGFRCINVNELVPGCYDRSIMMAEVPGFGRPMGAAFRGPAEIRMYHPVYTSEEWIERMRRAVSIDRKGVRLKSLLEGLAREKSMALEAGDEIMLNAIKGFCELLEPDSLEFFNAKREECRLTAPGHDESEQWHGIEGKGTGPFRWTRSRETTWRIPNRWQPSTVVKFVLPVRMVSSQRALKESFLRIGQQEIPLTYDRESGCLSAEIFVEAGVTSEGRRSWLREMAMEVLPSHDISGEVTLVGPPLLSPLETGGSTDSRQLGFALPVA